MLTAKRLRELIHYDPKTGVFTWRNVYRRGMKFHGKQAGSDGGGGYVRIKIGDGSYHAGRLAWLYVNGRWPRQWIDHINGNPSDNRIANLRDVSKKMNAQNRRRPYKNNTHGFLGVCIQRQRGRVRWTARIHVHGEGQRYLGYFMTPESAQLAYLKAKRQLHPGCTI